MRNNKSLKVGEVPSGRSYTNENVVLVVVEGYLLRANDGVVQGT